MQPLPAFWDQIAHDYAAKPVEDPAAFARKIEVMRRHMRPTDRVIDLGCGTGSLALLLAPYAAEVHGVDFSQEMVRIANGKLAAAKAPGVHFHVADAANGPLPFADASADLVSACSLLHLVEDRPATLARIFRLLRPGGTFVTSTVCLAESWIPYGPLLTILRWAGKAPPVWRLTRAALAAEVCAAGFVELEQPDVGAKAEVGFFTARRPGDDNARH